MMLHRLPYLLILAAALSLVIAWDGYWGVIATRAVVTTRSRTVAALATRFAGLTGFTRGAWGEFSILATADDFIIVGTGNAV